MIYPHDDVQPEPGAVNRLLDRIAAIDEAFGCHAPPYLAFGVAGVAVATFALTVCGLVLGLPMALIVGLFAASLATFVIAGLVRHALGRGNHVLLEDVLLVLAAAATVASAIEQPVWLTLDVMAVGLGGFLVFGRLGCLVAGCCHGRPAATGIRYAASSGISRPLIGMRLFPVQVVEAAWILGVTIVSATQLGGAQGTALWCWLLGYASGRFVLELARGDPDRPRLGPLSEAQWIAIGLVALRVAIEPRTPALLYVGGGAVLLLLVGWLTRRHWLALPRPALTVEDVARWMAFLDQLTPAPPGDLPPALHTAPGDVHLAVTADEVPAGRRLAWSLSGAARSLDPPRAFALAGLIAQRLPRHRVLRAERSGEVLHLWTLVDDPAGAAGSTASDPPAVVRDRAFAFARALRAMPPPSAASGAAAPRHANQHARGAVGGRSK